MDDKATGAGPTNYGISLRWLRLQDNVIADVDHNGIIDIRDILALNPIKAAAIYENKFWLPSHLGQVIDQPLATMGLNCVVNMGQVQGIKLLQRATNNVNPKAQLQADGILGPLSLQAINLCPAGLVMQAYKTRCVAFYQLIVQLHPDYQPELKGWLNRVSEY